MTLWHILYMKSNHYLCMDCNKKEKKQLLPHQLPINKNSDRALDQRQVVSYEEIFLENIPPKVID